MKSFFASLLLSLVLLVPSAQAAMPGTPEDGKLAFTVMRNSTPIGRHIYSFENQGNRQTVKVETRILYKFLGFTIYRFDHDSTETWENGRFVELVSTTNDDGTPISLKAQVSGQNLDITLNGAKSTLAETNLPASLWHAATPEAAALFDTANGRRFAIKGGTIGKDTEAGRQLNHFTLRGELKRDLWYDEKGLLAHVLFKARDESDIRYVRD
ncbi:MAG: hypothetical protein EPN26_07715 [Rhodospirillales bacterium]|nr:MAG: hypothetical protein EPN26_07715 [Rhodospirillales bacterium]